MTLSAARSMITNLFSCLNWMCTPNACRAESLTTAHATMDIMHEQCIARVISSERDEMAIKPRLDVFL